MEVLSNTDQQSLIQWQSQWISLSIFRPWILFIDLTFALMGHEKVRLLWNEHNLINISITQKIMSIV